ncbi:MAG: endonuclease [Candidatus Edwardsbacteria bacterium RIFOXYD12_FULL_50_11]|uniref:Endonuclease n=1 Tax=Candidatus Edwardsbacteria bacterium GWF2_54_11 TaxID=1817851 RepID=A0A1F5R4G2_9BACT|nr:MAG: endonuclease [Candidatus Edwardsbacteria bacterium RifOxyC12_full_54_24]OGF06847.1 MAG: endonuclease [Candidatus Edwardsbacteria bacterium RifOxyA12_full_54_48]OGF08913.1 MAG: endonuclease [Candidatus Edwardsbacteria bacterium GWF2_54_11]OGF10797.1 MAG: endonuclease [Candidatus Edwardsbacteria bacterium GWE2_54_12]OGF15577.1 MAG: endonuclease [Candidatus Edwardsbacteria bacterium RIFOXYD12_FULL_50_11]OGJ18634.1 MAG: endonuclease [Candidatus Edwardsbacteria bacterium RifOxyB12_full_52_3
MYDYYVYIICNSKKIIYIGVTDNLKRRVIEHKQKIVPGFSKGNSCSKLVFYQYFKDIRCAIAREKQLKSWRRQKKIELIELNNPRWEELYVE